MKFESDVSKLGLLDELDEAAADPDLEMPENLRLTMELGKNKVVRVLTIHCILNKHLLQSLQYLKVHLDVVEAEFFFDEASCRLLTSWLCLKTRFEWQIVVHTFHHEHQVVEWPVQQSHQIRIVGVHSEILAFQIVLVDFHFSGGDGGKSNDDDVLRVGV